MKVLHLLWHGHVGGAERAVYQLCRAQRQYSHFEPVMAYGQADGHYANLLRQDGIQVLDLGLRRGSDVLRLPSVRHAIRGFPIHHFHAAEIVPMLASCTCPSVARFYTHRGGASHYPLRRAVLYRLAGWIMRMRFHAFSGNTRHACASGPRVLGHSPGSWHVTYNGLDFSLLTARRPRSAVALCHGLPQSGHTVIGTSANLRQWKRIDLLLHACALIKTLPVIALIVGDGPDRIRLEKLSEDLGLGGHVVFTGRQHHVPDYLALMDIFVLPSNSEESFGNSAVEAMAMGLPCIVFNDGGGLTEHIDDGETGYIVSSVEDLARRLRLLAADTDLRRRLGAAASAVVRERYSLQAMVKRYNALYASCVL